MSAQWVTDSDDWRLQAEPRGTGAIAYGGWRCAGAMGFYHEHAKMVGDHVIGVPFFVTKPDGDTRHCCYCARCALELLGVTCPY